MPKRKVWLFVCDWWNVNSGLFVRYTHNTVMRWTSKGWRLTCCLIMRERGGYFWQLEVRYSVTRSACLLEMWSWQNVRVLPLIKWSPKYYCTIKRSTQIRNGISLQRYQERVKNMWFSGRRERHKDKRHQSLSTPPINPAKKCRGQSD